MNTPLRVLILEDQPADAELMLHELCRAGFAPDWQRVDSQSQFLAALETRPDLILSDYNLPDWNGLLALQRVREKGMDVPFILVSGAIVEEQAVAGMKTGASDYLIKDRLARLGPAVIRALEAKRLRDAECQAIQQLRLQAAAMEAAANGIIITDREGTILYVNSAFTTMTGYSKDDALGQNTRILNSEEHPPEFYQDLWETILAGKVWDRELINKRKDGSLYFALQTITPVCDERGEMTQFIAVQVDVSERKRLQEQFLQAQKMDAIGRLAGGVAHDFNNLLTVICGYSQLIPSDLPENSPARDMLREIEQAAERATGLTRQLLAFSRKQVMQLQVLNLNTELVELKKMLGRLIGEDIELILRPGPEEYLLRADPTQLQQVLVNLAVNARDAMAQGGTLTFATRQADLSEALARHPASAQAGPYVLLEVSDTGCGMSPEVLARIFEPFFTTKGPGKGTGLGLATVFGIVEQSGGFIEVESQPGQGTRFRVYLPRAAASRPERPMEPSGPGLRGGGETILLVEDDDGVRSLASRILRSGGYTVLEGKNGEHGLEVFGQHNGPIHLLLTDVVMPRMDGCQLAERLASKSPSLKALFMSGYLDDAIVRHGIQEKRLPFLQKPFSREALLGKVREVLDQQPDVASKTGTVCPVVGNDTVEEPIMPLQQIVPLADELADLKKRVESLEQRLEAAPQANALSMVVFSGELDKLLAAFVIATGAAACGMKVSMFFTFWGTAALKKAGPQAPGKTWIEWMFGWMLPGGFGKRCLSKLDMCGLGRRLIAREMRNKNIPDLPALIELAGQSGVEISICEMSMSLMGIRAAELFEYPGLRYCGVAGFVHAASASKTTLFI